MNSDLFTEFEIPPQPVRNESNHLLDSFAKEFHDQNKDAFEQVEDVFSKVDAVARITDFTMNEKLGEGG